MEIQLFVENIFLRLLESNNAPNYEHKKFALSVLQKIFENGRCILELFVNFDCQLGDYSLIENIVNLLAKIVQGKYSKVDY